MKYEISEEQYRKIILNYFNNMVGELKVKERNGNLIDIHFEDGSYFATLWFKAKNNALPGGCKTSLTLGHNFMETFLEVIPVIPELFSKIMLEYLADNLGFESQCIDFYYTTGEINYHGGEKVEYFFLNTKKK